MGGNNYTQNTMKTYKQYRAHNGRFTSQKEIARKELRKLIIYTLFPVAFFVATHIAQHNIYHEVIWTHEAEAFVPMTDICELRDVICDDEEPIIEAVEAISTALGRDVSDETVRRVTYLYEKATEADVPFRDAVKTIYCESQWMCVQSGIIMKNGQREPSYCIAQVHLPSHPHMTDVVMDAYANIDFLIDRWHDTKWYAYNRSTGQCTNNLIINL